MTKEEFKSCFDAFFDPLRNYLYYRSGDSELAQDIAQDTFMKIWEKQPEFDMNRIEGLLYKIAGNKFIDHTRKNKSSNEYLSQLKLDIQNTTPENHFQFEELKNQYEKTLAKLPENQRVVFLMNRLDGHTYKEIANKLELSQKAIEKRMSNALETLKRELK